MAREKASLTSTATATGHTMSTATTLRDFITELNEHLSAYRALTPANLRDIGDWVRDKLAVYQIRATYEPPAKLLELSDLRKAYADASEADRAAQWPALTEASIIMRSRFIIGLRRQMADHGAPIVQQSNGTIFVVEEIGNNRLAARILSQSPPDFNPTYPRAELHELLSNDSYQIYELKDGTTINLYYDDADMYVDPSGVHHKGRWVYSIRNAIAASEIVWRGHKYGEIVTDVLREYPAFATENLDRHASYTFGFKHPAYHPFGQPQRTDRRSTEPVAPKSQWIKHAWFIASTDLATGAIDYSRDIGLPLQTAVANLSARDSIPQLSHTLEDYLYHVRNRVIGPPPIRLGYILRAKSPQGKLSNIIITSNLWNKIRMSVYQRPFEPNKVTRDTQLENFRSLDYVVLEGFLDKLRQATFTDLFPQYRGRFDELNLYFNRAAARILNGGRKPQAQFGGRDTRPDPRDIVVDAIVAEMNATISSKFDRRRNERGAHKIIMGLLINPAYADTYYRIFTSVGASARTPPAKPVAN